MAETIAVLVLGESLVTASNSRIDPDPSQAYFGGILRFRQ